MSLSVTVNWKTIFIGYMSPSSLRHKCASIDLLEELIEFVIVRARLGVICSFYPQSTHSVITQHNACCRGTDLIFTDGKQSGQPLLMCERRKHSNSSTGALYQKQHTMLWGFLWWTISCIFIFFKENIDAQWGLQTSAPKMDFTDFSIQTFFW